jgi:hypothetical protein
MMTIERLVAELDASDAVPVAWRAAFLSVQTRGVIVTPMRTDFGGSVPLVLFTVDSNGTATGQAGAGSVSWRCVTSAP